MRSVWQVLLIVWLLSRGLTEAAADAREQAPQEQSAAQQEPAAAPSPQALKLQALQLAAEARALANARAIPPPERLHVYLGQARRDVQLRRLSVSVDQAPPIDVEVPPEAAAALQPGGALRRIATIGLAPGAHRLQATVFALSMKPQAADDLQQAALDTSFEKVAGEQAVVIRLREPGFTDPATVTLERWHPGEARRGWAGWAMKGLPGNEAERSYVPYSADDPAVAHARHLRALDDATGAVIELQALAGSIADPAALPVDYWLELARAYRAAGLLDQSASICDSLEARQADRATLALERLQLAQDAYDRGNLPQAEGLLLKARADMPPPSAADWRLAYAGLLLAQDKIAEALAVLKESDAASIEAFRYMSSGTEALRAAAFRRYNLAVALIQHGEERRGLSWLDLVGRLKGSDSQLLALRDRANLTLGWHFLKARLGGTAVGILGRIRTEGPFSNAALVGIGWAQLEPAGDKSWRKQLGDESITHPDISAALPSAMQSSLMRLGVLEPELFGARGTRPFASDKPPANRREGLHRAIEFWTMLKGRDAADASVQEAMLAIAYAHDQLDDFGRSREAYAAAIAMLESRHADLAHSAASIRAGELGRTLGEAGGIATPMEVMARHGLDPGATPPNLYATVSRYRDVSATLGLLGEALLAAPDAVADRVESLEEALKAQRAGDADLLQQLALAHIERRQRTLQDYMKAAYFSAARIEDRRLASNSQAMTTAVGNGIRP